VIDIRIQKIPDILSLPCFFIILILWLFLSPSHVFEALTAAAAGAGLLLIIRLCTRGLGLGDVKLAAVMGILCGLPAMLASFFTASILGIIGALLVLAGENIQKKCRSNPETRPQLSRRIPFAPFLCTGTVLILVVWKHTEHLFKILMLE
jgi:prepilin signal peptidase PulO-like enzyme (type II secretory pathway)